ncbi:MAG: hypothetical protein ACYST5_09345, partial [Planctomycetota bacterium]
MKSTINHPVKVTVTGFVVLLLLSLPLFWGRWLCETILREMIPSESRVITLRPSGLVPSELENDANLVRHSEVYARMVSVEPPFSVLEIFDHFETRKPGGRHSNIYYYDKDENYEDWIYFDERIGQIVCSYINKERMPDKTLLVRQIQLYAGPEGVSETADKTLSRFISPTIDRIWYQQQSLILYDKELHRFFKINFDERTVTKGHQISTNDPHEPIQIGQLNKNSYHLNLRWGPPMVKVTREEAKKKGHLRRFGDEYTIPIIDSRYSADQYLLVLDESGRIDLLDRETLEFVGTAGYLPAPQSLFPPKNSVTPKDLLAYDVKPLTFRPESNYRGIFAASVCREGTAMALAVFDEEGRRIKTEHTKLPKQKGSRTTYLRSSKAVFFEAPWAPVLTITKYLLENLHPPLLSLASYFTASAFEAASGHRALFFLPNSFIAMQGRDDSENFAERFMSALGWILPSIILAIWLGCRVSKDAETVGLSENARLYWIIGTLAFGLAGYITYRLTRPKITLVTCQNCGKLRRPDMNKCHRCKSDWYVPELTPPT